MFYTLTLAHLMPLRVGASIPLLFIEVVDKRYFICTSITSFQLLPPCLGYPESVQFHFIKNTVTDFLFFHASERILDTFVASCLEPGDTTLRASFAMLRDMATDRGFTGSAAQIAQGVARMVQEVEAEYGEQREKGGEAWSRFLPPPDLNKHAKQV